MKILRGVCTSAMTAAPHKINVSVEGICTDLKMDISNGLYLRKGDEVFVYFEDEYKCPLILGRCGGQLELQDLVNVINKMVEVFNSHTHVVSGTASGTVVTGTATAPTTQQQSVTVDKILY